jgi:hypothetical protein
MRVSEAFPLQAQPPTVEHIFKYSPCLLLRGEREHQLTSVLSRKLHEVHTQLALASALDF